MRLAIGLALTVLVALGLALIARDRIAESLARHWLAQHGVASKLKVRALSLTGLKASLRLGDSADPDFTVDEMDVGYGLTGPWQGKAFGVQTRSLRLVRPRLRLRLSAGHINLGALEPLIQEAAKHPSSGGPAPDVTVEDGVALLLTPDGHVRFRGGGTLRGGALTGVDGQVDPFVFTVAGVQVQGPGGSLHLARQGEQLMATADFGPVAAMGAQGRLDAARITLTGALPYPAAARLVGPLRLALVARGVSASGGETHADGGTVSADLDGALDATGARQAFSGHLLATAQLASLSSGAANARQATGEVDLAHLSLTHDKAGGGLTGDGRLALTAGGATAAAIGFSGLSGSADIQGLRAALGDSGFSASARLDGALAGRGGVPAAAARRIAAAVPILSGEPAYASAMARALGAFSFAAPHWRADVSDRGARLTLGSPVRLASTSGARAVIALPANGVAVSAQGAHGAADLDLDGGGLPALKVQAANAAISAAGYGADLSAQGQLDALFARGADIQLKGRLAGSGARLRFDLAGCSPVSARRLAFDPNPVSDVSASLCPADGPLVEVAGGGWRARGRMRQARGDIASFAADLRGADGAFEAAGAASRLDTAVLTLDRGELSDRTDPIRFRPLGAAGKIALAKGVWSGAFSAATRAGHPIGRISLRHDVASGVGRADIEASRIIFAPGALQPAELTPLANFARDADGPASFTGWFAWAPGHEPTSGGELLAQSLKFKSPLGPVLGIEADLHFTNLAPLTSAPSQRVDIGLVQALTPLSGLSAQFELGPQSISIEAASGGVASGHVRLEPLVAPLAGGSSVKGVLVLDHVNVADILAASSLADTIKMDAVVDGRIPFELGPAGLTIQQGHLAAVGPGRISISRKALSGGGASVSATPVTGGGAQANFAQDLAYQAMENLAFDQLDATVNSQAGDRLGVLFHIKGRHDPPQAMRATIAMSDVIAGHPLARPIALPSDTKIDLTLDTSLNFGELVRALGQAWRDSLQDNGAPNRSTPVQGQAASVTTTK